ncbi:MAG: glycosyltransferase family 4 protein [Acidobacteria bacterium]|nr:glycosyltransferase family 4 protein [Acidobacteriota bacterium]
MNIACDARALVGPRTGVGAWTTAVMGGLAATAGWRIILAASRAIDLPPELAVPGVDMLPPPRLRVPGTLWLNSVLPARLEAVASDVFVGALAVVPRGCPVPAVAVVHDLTPRTLPGRHTMANRFCFNAYVEESLERAAAVVAVSAATAAELEATFSWLRGRVRVIPNGVDERFGPPPPEDVGAELRRRFTGGRPYILHLGTLEPRKGIGTLVAAWELIHERSEEPPDLVLAGAPGWGRTADEMRLADPDRRRHVHLPGYVSSDDARDLLRHAEVFVLASEGEGFGLPLAEAICCGTPAVATDVPALVEVAGGAALHVPAGEPRALAAAISRALEPVVADSLRRRAVERSSKLRWGPSISAWRHLLQEVAMVRE